MVQHEIHEWRPDGRYIHADQFRNTEFYNLAKPFIDDPSVTYLQPNDQLEMNGKVLDVWDPAVLKMIGDGQRRWMVAEGDAIGRSLQ